VTARCEACSGGSEAGRSPTPGAATLRHAQDRHHAQEEAAGEAEEGQGKDAGAPKAACPREGGEQCQHPAGGVYRGVADGGGVTSARVYARIAQQPELRRGSSAVTAAGRRSLQRAEPFDDAALPQRLPECERSRFGPVLFLF
jgi:hypothetical protein